MIEYDSQLEHLREIGQRNVAIMDLVAKHCSHAKVELADWLGRLRTAQRHFHEAVIDRGAEMNEQTHFLWTQIHNDGVLQLENAITRVMGDVHALTGAPDNFIDAIRTNIEASRAELGQSMVSLVARIDELCGLKV